MDTTDQNELKSILKYNGTITLKNPVEKNVFKPKLKGGLTTTKRQLTLATFHITLCMTIQ